MELELLRHGSSKDIYRVDKKMLDLRFLDQFSAFDVGPCPQLIPGKGEAICAAAVKSFEIAKAIGVPTHFVEQIDEVTIRVREVQVITDRPLTGQDTNCLVPAEWITRYRVAGSLWRKFKGNKASPMAFGFAADAVPEEGAPLPWPVKHFTTKFEAADRDLSAEEALALCGLTPEDAEQFWDMCVRLDGAISLAYQLAGFAYFDGKKEVALVGPNRQKIIADTFGTQDEDRPVCLADLRQGRGVEHYGKEFIRQYLIKAGYYGAVQKARAANEPDPPYPLIPEDVIAEMARRYESFADRYSNAFDRY